VITARSLLVVGCCMVARHDLVRAQDSAQAKQDRPRHGLWGGFGLGYGSAGFSCDTDCSGSRFGGVTVSFDLGWTFGPHVRLGAEGRGWMHGLNGNVPEVYTGGVLLSYYPRIRGGPFYEGGVGVSYYDLGKGTGDPLEPVSGTPYYSGTGWGLTLGAGWDFGNGGVARLDYAYGNVGSLHAPDGATIATGWRQNVLFIEVGIRDWP